MREYTKTEKRAIDEAFAAIEYYLGTAFDWATVPRWQSAFKVEKRSRGATIAKALLVRGWSQGVRENPSAHDLAYHADGVVTATLLGARDHGSASPQVAKLLDMAAAAHEAHEATFSRAIGKS